MTADNVIPLVPSDTLDRALIAELRHACESLTRRGIDATWIDIDELRALIRAADERDTLISERDAMRARLDRITAPTAEVMPIAAEPDDEPDDDSRCGRCGVEIKADGRTLSGWRHLETPSGSAHEPLPARLDPVPWRHPNCRCTVEPILKPDDEPEEPEEPERPTFICLICGSPIRARFVGPVPIAELGRPYYEHVYPAVAIMFHAEHDAIRAPRPAPLDPATSTAAVCKSCGEWIYRPSIAARTWSHAPGSSAGLHPAEPLA